MPQSAAPWEAKNLCHRPHGAADWGNQADSVRSGVG